MTLALSDQAISNEKIVPNKIYHDLMLLLDKEEQFISYTDLLKIYETITTSEDYIPGMNKILFRLMAERNEHPRVDQMILICTAKLIGSSKHEIPHASDLLRALIVNERTNLWTASFVAGALGDYFIDLENGARLADMIDRKIDSLIEKESNSTDEVYGFHFLPPPTTEYIKKIISQPKEQKRRESTRLYYYTLRMEYSEEQIKDYLLFLDKHGQIDTKRKIDFTMKYLFKNIELTQAAIVVKEQNRESSTDNHSEQQ